MDPHVVYHQPQGTPHQVVVVQPQQAPVGQQQNITEWTTDAFACFQDFGTCVFQFFCPCIHACKVAGKMSESCWVPTCVGGAGIMAMRTKIRTAYGINGSLCGDCCMVTWCTGCALCQMDREMDNRGTAIFQSYNMV